MPYKNKSDRIKSQSRYAKTKKGKLAIAKADKKYNESERGKMMTAKNNSKHRRLGFNPIYDNIISEPYIWHHINHDDVTTVPLDLHNLYNGSGFKFGKHEFMVHQIIKQIYKKEMKKYEK